MSRLAIKKLLLSGFCQKQALRHEEKGARPKLRRTLRAIHLLPLAIPSSYASAVPALVAQNNLRTSYMTAGLIGT